MSEKSKINRWVVLPAVPSDFCICALEDAVIEFKRVFNSIPTRLIVSDWFKKEDVFDIIENAKAIDVLDYEISKVIPTDAWMLFDKESHCFYNIGV